MRRGGESFAHADEVQRLVRRGVLPGVQQNEKLETRIKVGLRDFERESEMTKARKRKHVGALPITGPANCWRSAWIAKVCCVCGERSEIMHSPTRQAGIYCPAHCPACNPAPEAPAVQRAATPLPEVRGAVLANAGARGGGFNKPRPFGKAYDKYLAR